LVLQFCEISVGNGKWRGLLKRYLFGPLGSSSPQVERFLWEKMFSYTLVQAAFCLLRPNRLEPFFFFANGVEPYHPVRDMNRTENRLGAGHCGGRRSTYDLCLCKPCLPMIRRLVTSTHCSPIDGSAAPSIFIAEISLCCTHVLPPPASSCCSDTQNCRTGATYASGIACGV
jgi:hypothetical protein